MYKYLSIIFVIAFLAYYFFLHNSNLDLYISWHEKYIANLENKIDISASVEEIFTLVFSQLQNEVIVYPTENYYYYSLRANGKDFWGNIRLAVGERDQGILNFAFWEFDNFPQRVDDDKFLVKFKKFSEEDGLLIFQVNPFRYSVTWQGKRVYFNFNQIEQRYPLLAKLNKDEVAVMHTFDESGLKFFLLFDKDKSNFIWILDEEDRLLDDFIVIDDYFLIAKRTQFVFYDDKKLNRKVLVGVYGENMKRNNYFDGPFDQLADNYIKGDFLKKYLELAYPYVKGRINEFGIFMNNDGSLADSRVAITPYHDYASREDLLYFLNSCKELNNLEEMFSCLIYDYKKSVPAS